MDPNNNVGKEFLEIPKPHHHVSRVLVLVIILAVIIGLALAYNYFFVSKKMVIEQPIVTTNAIDLAKQAQVEAAEKFVPANLTPQEVKAKQAQISATSKNASVKLTPAEIEAKQAQLKATAI